MERERHLPGKEMETEIQYYISSLPVDAARVAQGIRQHWEVENKAHWVLDVAFKEDDSRIRKRDGAENVAIIRRFCLNLARLDGKKNSMRGKLKQAGWSDTRRAEILFGAVEKWERKIGVQANEIRIRKIKARWGTCNSRARRIWLNLELMKKPASCLEYVVVHELIHLIERKHNYRFRELMDRHMPQWRSHRDEPNRAPLAHWNWEY